MSEHGNAGISTAEEANAKQYNYGAIRQLLHVSISDTDGGLEV